jgi:hypothetical protein
MSKKETPTAVRVARWTAAAAAITALGTIGNTFIEKRPWFLGGEEEKPAIVSTVKAPAPVVEHHESPVIHFEVASRTSGVKKSVVADSAPTTVAMTPPPTSMVTMSAASDLGWYRNTLNYIIYKPVTSSLIIGSFILILVYFVVEYTHRKKKNNLPFTG